MTVLYLIDTLEMGGAEQSILEIASRFKQFKPVVCHLYPGETLKSAYEAAGIEVISLNLPVNSKHKAILPELLKIVEKYKPVLIHASLYRSMMVSRKLKRITGLPLVNSFVSNSYSTARTSKLKFTTRLKLKYYQFLDKSSAKIPDVYFSNSASIARSNADALHIPLKKILVIHRGRNIERYAKVTETQSQALRKNLGLEGKRVLLNVGRLLASKGQTDLIKAFSNIHKEYSDVVLLIAGEGAHRNTLEQLIEQLSLKEQVRLLGNRNDVEVLLSIADVFVFPSYFEGLPGVIVEAMMAKKIIIASDIPESRECVDDSSALFFPAGDIKHLTEQVKLVLDNPAEHVSKAKQAGLIAAEKFDIHNIAKQYEQVYAQYIRS